VKESFRKNEVESRHENVKLMKSGTAGCPQKGGRAGKREMNGGVSRLKKRGRVPAKEGKYRFEWETYSGGENPGPGRQEGFKAEKKNTKGQTCRDS